MVGLGSTLCAKCRLIFCNVLKNGQEHLASRLKFAVALRRSIQAETLVREFRNWIEGKRVIRNGRNRILWLLVIFCAFGLPARADMSDGEFESRVRDYILANPEIIVEALQVLSERERIAALESQLKTYAHIFEAEPALGFGEAQAPIRVIEFFDYKCAPCKAIHAPLKDAVAAHPMLRVEMMHLPILTPGSERAARFALAVKEVSGVASYQQAHDRLWTMTGPLRGAALKRLAAEMGLDWAVLEPVMNGKPITDQINATRDMAIDLGIKGTPAFVTPTSIDVGNANVEALIESWISQ